MKINKTLKWILFLLALIVISVLLIFNTDYSHGDGPKWGVTFSRPYTLELNLDWQEAYLAILDDLEVDNIRLSAYWDEIESEKDQYDFRDLDWQIDQAAKRDVDIILAIGRRLPRWPECHDPKWIKHYSNKEENVELLELIEILVERYKDNPQIKVWQVENEPLFQWFGFCPPPDEGLLITEIATVRRLDPDRPILVTDSGELSTWQKASKHGDLLGTTLYRIVWNNRLGFFDYWFVPPAFYRWKADLASFFHKNLDDWYVMELQMEPWTFDKNLVELSFEEQEQSFNLERFRDNIEYATKTGTNASFLWGVEYWYWLKEQGRPEMWDEAKKLWMK